MTGNFLRVRDCVLEKNKIIGGLEIVLFFFEILLGVLVLKKGAPITLSNIVFFGIMAFIAYKLLGFSKEKSMIHYNGAEVLILHFIFFYVVLYIFGLFFGFLKNAYSLKFTALLSNIMTALLLYGTVESFRYMIVKKITKENGYLYVLLTILLSILNIIMSLNGYDLSTPNGVFEFLGECVIYYFALNSLLSYLSYKYTYKLVILFLLFIDLPKYFLPIIPDTGVYIKTVFNLIFIFICYYKLSLLMEKYECRIRINRIKKNNIGVILVVFPLLILVGLVSGFFKYHLLAVGSNSMSPVFVRGDAVLIQKLKPTEYEQLQKGDILAFYYKDQIIVHRIVAIKKEMNKYYIQTKGDNNDTEDAFIIENKDIYGKVRYTVKYIGIPSVELSELLD